MISFAAPGPVPESPPLTRDQRVAVNTSQTLTRRVLLMRRYGGRCAFCGVDLLQSPEALLSATIDHMLPRTAGGRDVLGNCVPSCQLCNSIKGAVHASFHRLQGAILRSRAAAVVMIQECAAAFGLQFLRLNVGPGYQSYNDSMQAAMEEVAVQGTRGIRRLREQLEVLADLPAAAVEAVLWRAVA